MFAHIHSLPGCANSHRVPDAGRRGYLERVMKATESRRGSKINNDKQPIRFGKSPPISEDRWERVPITGGLTSSVDAHGHTAPCRVLPTLGQAPRFKAGPSEGESLSDTRTDPTRPLCR